MLAVDDGEVERYVMPFETPTPEQLSGGVPKNGYEVEFGVAGELALLAFYTGEYRLQLNDSAHLLVSAVAKAGFH